MLGGHVRDHEPHQPFARLDQPGVAYLRPVCRNGMRHDLTSGQLEDEICETDSLAKAQQKPADAERLGRGPRGCGMSLPIPFFRN